MDLTGVLPAGTAAQAKETSVAGAWRTRASPARQRNERQPRQVAPRRGEAKIDHDSFAKVRTVLRTGEKLKISEVRELKAAFELGQPLMLKRALDDGECNAIM